MRILVVGAGAVGGYFGGRLAEAGRDVTFLVRARRAADLAAKGLQIVSPHGNLTLHPKTVTAGEIAGPYDLLLLSVKGYALSAAIGDFAAAVGPETTILPVLNGMRHMDTLAGSFGEHALLGGVCLVATKIDDQGRILQLSEMQKLIYGELDGDGSPRLQQLDGTMQGAGFDAAKSDHIVRDMWQKWVQLASLGAANCLMRGNIGEISAIPGGDAAALSILRECAEIATSCGYPPPQSFLQQQTAALTAQGSQLTSSMYRDLMSGAPVEVDTILGDLLEYGRRNGLTPQLLQAAFVSLSIYQRGRERGKAAAD